MLDWIKLWASCHDITWSYDEDAWSTAKKYPFWGAARSKAL